MGADKSIHPALEEIQEKYDGAEKLEHNFEASKKGSIAYFLIPGPREFRAKLNETCYECQPRGGSLVVGMFDLIENDKAAIQIGEGVFLKINAGQVLWAFSPDDQLEQDREIVNSSKSAADILKLVGGGATVIMSSAAVGSMMATAGAGAAAFTSTLAAWGGGSIAAGGFGMVGGIVVIGGAAPSLMSVGILEMIASADNDTYSRKVIIPAALASGAAAAAATIPVAIAGSGGGGAAAITSGLAALGPGGMLGGLLTVTGIGSVVAIAGGGIAYGLTKLEIQRRLKSRRELMARIAEEMGWTSGNFPFH